MKIPGAERAIVDETKIRRYLLASDHPVGRWKARFFARLGFRDNNGQELQRSLFSLAQTAHAVLGAKNDFGQKYVVRGTILGPAGREALIETVWIVVNDEDAPRLVTAYPGDSE